LKDTTTAANTKPAAVIEAPPDVEAVASLRAAGLTDAVASRIVLEKGRRAALDALAAYKAARNVRNPVGWLIRAVEQKYRHVPKDAPEGSRMARRVLVVVPPVVSSTGAQGYAAFAAMRERLTGKANKSVNLECSLTCLPLLAVSDSGG
jgi:predicted DCC family thiol-disulfide oxidoreductase YuxK